MNSKNKLAEMPIRPLLYTMAVPLMLSLLIQSLYNIVDSIFVARLSGYGHPGGGHRHRHRPAYWCGGLAMVLSI